MYPEGERPVAFSHWTLFLTAQLGSGAPVETRVMQVQKEGNKGESQDRKRRAYRARGFVVLVVSLSL